MALIALFACALLVASPRVTHPGFAPTDQPVVPDREQAANDRLRALVAGLSFPWQDAGQTPDRHAVRLPVTGYRVRLTVDATAAHPLAGRVDVRPNHLGTPGKILRQVRLTMAEAPAPAPAAPPEPATPAIRIAGPSGAAAPPVASTVVLASAPPRSAPVPATPPSPTVKRQTPLVGPGHTVLVAGDSLSIFLAQALRPLLANRPGTTFTAEGKVSSGLARPDFFDWEATMRQLATRVRPDTVVIMIAANDNKTLTRPDGSKVAFGRPGWDQEYARRVRHLVELARLGNPQAAIAWVGAPVMADARLNADVAAINAVIRRQVDALPGCRFVDVSRTLSDAAGRYVAALPTPTGPRTARTKDGVHLTPYGARLLAEACLATMSPTMAALTRP